MMYDTSNPPVCLSGAIRMPKSVIANSQFQTGCSFKLTVAILILVGFRVGDGNGRRGQKRKRDVPIAVITSLLVQGPSATCLSILPQTTS